VLFRSVSRRPAASRLTHLSSSISGESACRLAGGGGSRTPNPSSANRSTSGTVPKARRQTAPKRRDGGTLGRGSPQVLSTRTVVHRVGWLPTGGQGPMIRARRHRICIDVGNNALDGLPPMRDRSLPWAIGKMVSRPPLMRERIPDLSQNLGLRARVAKCRVARKPGPIPHVPIRRRIETPKWHQWRLSECLMRASERL